LLWTYELPCRETVARYRIPIRSRHMVLKQAVRDPPWKDMDTSHLALHS